MKYILNFSPRALDELMDLSGVASKEIVHKLEYFTLQENPMRYAKPLHGRLDGLYRFRIGQYRAIFEKQSNGEISILYIIHIAHRKDIYE